MMPRHARHGTTAAPRGAAPARPARRRARAAGFTLLELLTVLAIMALLMALAAASIVGMQRGAEMRGVVSTVRATIALARQHAVTRRLDTMVVFRQTSSNALYYVFEKGGTVSANDFSGSMLTDVTAAWTPGEHAGRTICNMRDGRMGVVRTNTATTMTLVSILTDAAGVPGQWRKDDEYGWMINEKCTLSPGVVFWDGANASSPDPIRFRPSGGTGGAGERMITLTEIGRLDAPGAAWQEARITVWGLTGLTKVEM